MDYQPGSIEILTERCVAIILQFSSTAVTSREVSYMWGDELPSQWATRNCAVNALALVRLAWWRAVTADDVTPALRRCVTVTSGNSRNAAGWWKAVKFADDEMSVEQITSLVQTNPYLHELIFEAWTSWAVDPFLQELATNRKIADLQVLEVPGCDMADAGLKVVVQHCPHLRHLNMRQCIKISDLGLETLVLHCPGLHYLDVSYFTEEDICTEGECARHYFPSRMKITDAGLKALANCHWLEHLNLSCCRITDAGLKVVAQHCSRLQHVNISCCLGVTEASLEALAWHCPGVLYLNVDYINKDITDAGLRAAITQRCPALQQLRMCGWEKITEEGLGILIQHYPGLQYLHAHRGSRSALARGKYHSAVDIINFDM
eukprot:TRINITY_DN42562_c0_g1_i1.p1 TRINITY_DN42562_c0_g1~~TRINITY_DN42562_c0_g1_i1.p1  ORF type:complete len:376 (-),score=21.65 TRINITY_DN42562_c0_g1_i1:66-1193(-)